MFYHHSIYEVDRSNALEITWNWIFASLSFVSRTPNAGRHVVKWCLGPKRIKKHGFSKENFLREMDENIESQNCFVTIKYSAIFVYQTPLQNCLRHHYQWSLGFSCMVPCFVIIIVLSGIVFLSFVSRYVIKTSVLRRFSQMRHFRM